MKAPHCAIISASPMRRREGMIASAVNELNALTCISPAAFKATMRRFASTVSVVTSGYGSALNGMTATAVCSVSADPPSILIVVNRTNRSHELIQQSGAYTVNVLSTAQEDIARHFASSATEAFAAIPHSLGLNGCPIIGNCASFLECVVESRIRSGTHSVFIGRVVAAGESDRLPLLHFNSAFRS
jgi:flavin reductase (DIM6/NTAB) family NADH-FMN oxidoreductase RutF